MYKLLILLSLFLSSTICRAQSSGYRLLDLEEFSMKYQEFDGRRDPYAPEYDNRWAYRASAQFRLSILESLYWDNNVHTEALKSGAVKTVGWHWTLGMRINSWLDVYHEHWSKHILDEDRPRRDGGNVFPVEDSYGIKLKFVEKTDGRTIGSWLFGR